MHEQNKVMPNGATTMHDGWLPTIGIPMLSYRFDTLQA